MNKNIVLKILFPFICLAQKIVPNQSLISICTQLTKYNEKEESSKIAETDVFISAEVKNAFLFIYNYNLKNAKEKSFKITKFTKKEGKETSFTLDFDGSTNTLVYNSANEGDKKTFDKDINRNFIYYNKLSFSLS